MVETKDIVECPTCLGGTNPHYTLNPCPRCWGSQKIPQIPSPTRRAAARLHRWLVTRVTKLRGRTGEK